MKTHVGSCMCGAIGFELIGDPIALSYCHCSRCRKIGGQANVQVRAKDFRWTRGADLVVRHVPPAPWTLIRCFCSVCGTYLGEPETHPKTFPLNAQLFDDDLGIRPVLHEHVSEKANWYEITDGLPQYADAPPPSAFKQS